MAGYHGTAAGIEITGGDIRTLAAEFDRLWPEQVDATERDWGHGYEAGHVGHGARGGDDMEIVGWFGDGGNVGHPCFHVAPEDADAACRIAQALAPGSVTLTRFGELCRAAGLLVEGGEGCYIPRGTSREV